MRLKMQFFGVARQKAGSTEKPEGNLAQNEQNELVRKSGSAIWNQLDNDVNSANFLAGWHIGQASYINAVDGDINQLTITFGIKVVMIGGIGIKV